MSGWRIIRDLCRIILENQCQLDPIPRHHIPGLDQAVFGRGQIHHVRAALRADADTSRPAVGRPYDTVSIRVAGLKKSSSTGRTPRKTPCIFRRSPQGELPCVLGCAGLARRLAHLAFLLVRHGHDARGGFVIRRHRKDRPGSPERFWDNHKE